MLNEKFIATLKKTEDGAVIVPFVDDKTNEVLVELVFNPEDVDFWKNFKVLATRLKTSAKYIEHLALCPDGTLFKKDPKSKLLLKKAENTLKEAMDKCFGRGTYKKLFAKRRPYANVGGNAFAAVVIETFKRNIFITEER